MHAKKLPGSSQLKMSLFPQNSALSSHSAGTRFEIRYSSKNCAAASPSYAQILRVDATSSIYASARCGLTGRSTGHFAAVQVWALKA